MKSVSQWITSGLSVRPAWIAWVALVCLVPMGHAQQTQGDEDDDASEESPMALDSVNVTARLRSESLLEVPVSVTAVSGEELAEFGAQDITYLSQIVPNTTLEVSRGTNTTLTAFVRGVGQQDPVAGFEAGVGIYLDGVYLNRPQGAVLDIYDVEQIEVLRGPQGTLYGRNTIGGAVKYVTRRLSFEPHASISASVGSFSQADLKFSGQMPLSNTLAIGGSVASFKHSGYGDNILQEIDHYNKELVAFRGSAEWTPSSDLLVRFSMDYLEDDSNPRSGHRLIPGLFNGAPVLDDVFDTRAGINQRNEAEQYGGAIQLEYDINPSWLFKSITAYRDDESFQAIDFESLPQADVDVPVVYRNDQFSQEFQFNYRGERLQGVTGFYYLDASAFNAFDVVLASTGELIGLPGLNAFTLGDVDTESWSIFTDYSFDLGDYLGLETGLELSIGGRYTEDERSSRVLRQTFIGGNSATFGGNAIPISTTSDFAGSKTFDDFSTRASLSWQARDDLNLYLSYSEGFKGGGFDPRGATTAAPDLNNDGVVSEDEIFDFMLFEPEEVETIELGAKTVFADGNASLNMAFFYSDYTDVQVPGSIGLDTDGDGVSDTFTGVTTNAGAATVKGVEIEGRAWLGQDVITDGDAFSTMFSLGWIDAEYDEFFTAVTDPVTGLTTLQNVASQRVFQNTPEWTAHLNMRYDRPLDIASHNGNLSIIAGWSYRDDTNQFETPSQFLDEDSYSLFDMSVVWSTQDGRYEVGLYGRNLTDEEYKVSGYLFATPDGTASTLGLEGIASAFYGPPRTVTATFSINF